MKKRTVLNRYHYGDMQVSYYLDAETKEVSFVLSPWEEESGKGNLLGVCEHNLANVKILQHQEGLYFQYSNQEVVKEETKTIVLTYLKESRGYELVHELTWNAGTFIFESSTTLRNESDHDIMLEHLTAVAIDYPLTKSKDTEQSVVLHRIKSEYKYSQLESIPFENVKFSDTPLKQYIPFLAMEHLQSGVCLGILLTHNNPWQLEAYQNQDGITLFGGGADYSAGHWRKKIASKEAYTTQKALISVCHGFGVDFLCDRFAKASHMLENNNNLQETAIIYEMEERDLGKSFHKDIGKITSGLSEMGITHICLPQAVLANEELRQIIETMKEALLVPGIAMKLLKVSEGEAGYDFTEHLLKRDEILIVRDGNRYWDMRDSFVGGFLTVRIISFLKQYGFGYLKLTDALPYGIGFDGAESLGEGLSQQQIATDSFVNKIKQECPNLLLNISENDMSSTVHRNVLPIAAINKQRLTDPCRNLVTVRLRRQDSPKLLAYYMASTFFGSICFAGEIYGLKKEQRELLMEGITFYRMIQPILKNGYTLRYGDYAIAADKVYGWQGVLCAGNDGGSFVVIHTFEEGYPDWIEIPVPAEIGTRIVSVYSDDMVEIRLVDGILRYRADCNMRAVAVYMQ